jgi:hypothetical protein
LTSFGIIAKQHDTSGVVEPHVPVRLANAPAIVSPPVTTAIPPPTPSTDPPLNWIVMLVSDASVGAESWPDAELIDSPAAKTMRQLSVDVVPPSAVSDVDVVVLKLFDM